MQLCRVCRNSKRYFQRNVISKHVNWCHKWFALLLSLSLTTINFFPPHSDSKIGTSWTALAIRLRHLIVVCFPIIKFESFRCLVQLIRFAYDCRSRGWTLSLSNYPTLCPQLLSAWNYFHAAHGDKQFYVDVYEKSRTSNRLIELSNWWQFVAFKDKFVDVCHKFVIAVFDKTSKLIKQ